jgi:hypothetical protein
MILSSSSALIYVEGNSSVGKISSTLFIQDYKTISHEELERGLKIFFRSFPSSFEPIEVKMLLPERVNLLQLHHMPYPFMDESLQIRIKKARAKALSSFGIIRNLALFCPLEVATSCKRFYCDPLILGALKAYQVDELARKGLIQSKFLEAVEYDNLSIVKQILTYGLDHLNLIEPAIIACQNQQWQMLKVILSSNRIDEETQGILLRILVKQANLSKVCEFLPLLSVTEDQMVKAMLIAIRMGLVEILESLLICQMVGYEKRDELIFEAVLLGHVEITKTLLAYLKIDPILLGDATLLAVENGHVMLVDFFLILSDLFDAHRNFCVKKAAELGFWSIMIRFKLATLSPSIRQEALYLAAERGNLDCVLELFHSGSISHTARYEAAMIALQKGFFQIHALLKD